MGAEQLVSILSSSAMVAYAIEELKKSRFVPWITMESKRLNRLVMMVATALSAVGVHFAFDAPAHAPGVYVITVSGLTLASVLHGIWHWLNSMVFTQVVYDTTLSKAQQPAVDPVPASLQGVHPV